MTEKKGCCGGKAKPEVKEKKEEAVKTTKGETKRKW